jgi:hypothetical protein
VVCLIVITTILAALSTLCTGLGLREVEKIRLKFQEISLKNRKSGIES